MDVVRVPLTRGMVALVDECDAEAVSRFQWSVASNGYAIGRAKQGQAPIRMHRLVMGFPTGNVDHISGDKLDNRRSNLRIATNSQNQANRSAMPHSSRFKGVTRNAKTRRFESQVWHNGKRHYLGTHATEEAAALAYDQRARELFGAFARLNFAEAAQ